ncbi:DNA polymerase III subunit beta [Virgibacillus flavescens]|uniref:DNA polymerase III subunit beta n=1 Tax=Virgibacillus flavescens TaxID=1611422 RepID=UPI003D34C9F9
MEFVIDRNYFSKAILDLSFVATSKSTFSTLASIKITSDKSGLTLSGNDSEVLIEKFLPVDTNKNLLEIKRFGVVHVPFKHLYEIVKKLPDQISFKLRDNEIVTICSEDVTINLNALEEDVNSIKPDINSKNCISVPGKKLIEMIKQTVFAAASNESRPVLTGVNMVISKNKLVCVATNSHRLALKELEIDSGLTHSLVVPNTSLKELIKLVNQETESIQIYFSDSYVMFSATNIVLISKLIDGNYPEISSLIPKESNTVLTLNTKRFLKAVDRASLFAAKNKNNTFKLKIMDGSTLMISSNMQGMGKIEVIQSVNSISGNHKINLSLDGKFVLDAIKTITTEEIRISLGDSMKPVLIEPVDKSTFIHLVSPVRTYEGE